MSRLDTLLTFFPTGTAEGDRHILDRAFVAPNQLAEVLSCPSGSPRVLAGNKGIGKTALLEWLHAAAVKEKIPVLFLRPDDLDTSAAKEASDIGTLKREMYHALLSGVAGALGSHVSGLMSGDAAALYKTAIATGHREPDFGTKLLTVLSSVSKQVTKVDASALAKDLESATPQIRLGDVVSRYLTSSGKLFFLLFDDTDQVASPDRPEHLNRIWALLLAVRKLTQAMPQLRCFLTLRMEVWMRLLNSEQGQRDQVDHFRTLVVFLRTHDEQLRAILERRLALAAQECGLDPQRSYEAFFEGREVCLPTSDQTRRWRSFLLKSSRERPRDMIQLVQHLGRNAVDSGALQISQRDVDAIMEKYSRERAEDLAREHQYDCASFLDVVRSFAGCSFELPFEDLRRHLRSIPSRFSASVRRKLMKPDDDEDAIAILALLHESGFINPRIPDKTRPREFSHVTFLDDPSFVQSSRWNDMQGVTWEVHPVFRSYLHSLDEARERRRLTKANQRRGD